MPDVLFANTMITSCTKGQMKSFSLLSPLFLVHILRNLVSFASLHSMYHIVPFGFCQFLRSGARLAVLPVGVNIPGLYEVLPFLKHNALAAKA